jgi:ABC-type Na+ efflux pump permease subunit
MAYVRTRTGSSLRVLLVAVYLAIGILVANSHHYFRGIRDFKSFISAVLAVVLWPLVLASVNLHIK